MLFSNRKDMEFGNGEICNIKKYTTNVIPDDLPSCKALDWGIPTINVAYKLEETDVGAENEYDYHDDIHYQQDKYMRNAMTDRNCEIPFSESDIPSYNITKNSGALNVRYNGGRGTTDYRPSHPEMMIGQDIHAGEDTGLKLAELKRYTAQRSEDAEVRMGNNDIDTIPEQPWADPEISYAKKAAMKWTNAVNKTWSWPQFYNINISHQTELNPEGNKENIHNCATACTNEEINANAAYDDLGKVIHQQIGYEYNLGQYQNPTIEFQEGDYSKHMSTKHPERAEEIRIKNKQGNASFTKDSKKTKDYKAKLYKAMKSAAETQKISGKMGVSDKSRKVKSGEEFKNRSVIRDIQENRKKNKEIMSNIRSGIHQTKDMGFLNREKQNQIKETLQMKSNMVKGSRNEGNINFLQRNIVNSMKLNRESRAKLCATSLANNVDRQKIMRDIETTHKTGCSQKSKCYTGGTGEYLEESRKVADAPTQVFYDNPYTHHSKSKLLDTPKSRTESFASTHEGIENISDTTKNNGRNRW